jgi:hypothetical protein
VRRRCPSTPLLRKILVFSYGEWLPGGGIRTPNPLLRRFGPGILKSCRGGNYGLNHSKIRRYVSCWVTTAPGAQTPQHPHFGMASQAASAVWTTAVGPSGACHFRPTRRSTNRGYSRKLARNKFPFKCKKGSIAGSQARQIPAASLSYKRCNLHSKWILSCRPAALRKFLKTLVECEAATSLPCVQPPQRLSLLFGRMQSPRRNPGSLLSWRLFCRN